ncbi:MAG: polyprenyl synthetase family protein, partial [Alloprevotella tannerae]|nr:polyprenyl synthetase family protein [Alloprevotella tannerae]
MENFLVQIENALSQQAYPTRPAGLYEPIAYALSGGGKRVRPHLTLLACSLYSDEPEKAIPAALSVETYHNHTLLHDDLMDGADLRRGRPTVFRKWDANTAILSGDTMLILAFNHLLEGGYPNAAELLQLLARTAREVCEGQQYDMN